MSDTSPLIPKGSLLEEQAKSRPHLRIAVCIVAVHLVFLGGLLMQGCKRDEPTDTAGVQLPTLDPTNLFDPAELQTLTNPLAAEGIGEPGPSQEQSDVGFGGNEFPGGLQEMPGVIPPEAPLEPEPAPPTGMQEYKVEAGDYFLKIARKFNVSVSDIAQANPGVDSTKLQIGQTLKIPSGAATPTPLVPNAAPPSGTGIYTVKKGDTLTRIAANHGTTVAELKRMNGLVMDRIIINQKLKVPVPAQQ